MNLARILSLNSEFFVWDAVVAWRDRIYQADFYNNTKGCYLTGLLKLIEFSVIDVRLPLSKINEDWVKDCKLKIDGVTAWAAETKTIRKTCLNSFYKFVQKDFDRGVMPYQRHPQPNEIKHILSSVKEKALTEDISPSVLCNALSKINERDAYIVWLMMHTGETLETILDLRKTPPDYEPPYIRFNGMGKHVPDHITDGINELCKNSAVYLFETAGGKRISRTQVMRNLKKTGHNIGLKFDLTPKVLHGFVVAYMSRDKRSELEIALSH
jgi:site-specific recombinase XerC